MSVLKLNNTYYRKDKIDSIVSKYNQSKNNYVIIIRTGAANDTHYFDNMWERDAVLSYILTGRWFTSILMHPLVKFEDLENLIDEICAHKSTNNLLANHNPEEVNLEDIILIREKGIMPKSIKVEALDNCWKVYHQCEFITGHLY